MGACMCWNSSNGSGRQRLCFNFKSSVSIVMMVVWHLTEVLFSTFVSLQGARRFFYFVRPRGFRRAALDRNYTSLIDSLRPPGWLGRTGKRGFSFLPFGKVVPKVDPPKVCPEPKCLGSIKMIEPAGMKTECYCEYPKGASTRRVRGNLSGKRGIS